MATSFDGLNITDVRFGTIPADRLYKGNTLIWERHTKRLPAEFQEVEYIESVGSQRINTLETADDNTQMKCNMYITRPNTSVDLWYGVFGERNGGDYNALNVWLYKGQFYVGVGNSFPRIGSYQDVHYTVTLTSTKAIFNDTEVALSRSVGTSPSNIFICNISTGTTSAYRYPIRGIRIYDFEISKNDVLVKSFVPCYCKVAVTDVNGNSCEPNTIGMYELVNGKFYTNAGGGTFLKGQDI